MDTLIIPGSDMLGKSGEYGKININASDEGYIKVLICILVKNIHSHGVVIMVISK